jgi:hypothetical protein
MGGAHDDDDTQASSEGGEAQATESFGDELEAPKADDFTEGKAIAWRMLASYNGDECR